MNFDLLGLVIIVVVAAAFFGLFVLGKKVSFMKHMMIALGGGLVLGTIIQLIWPVHVVGKNTFIEAPVAFAFEWIDIVKNGYGNLLKLMIVPLVLVAIITGILKASDSSAEGNKIGKGAAVAIATLMITCGLSAAISVVVTLAFNAFGLNMSAGQFLSGVGGHSGSASLSGTIGSIFGATNIFDAFAKNEILPVMFLALIFAIIISNMKKSDDESYQAAGAKVQGAINVAYEFTMGLVELVIGIAPYGVFAFILSFAAQMPFENYLALAGFVVASYVAMLAMWVVHFLIMFFCGVTPGKFFKKCGKALIMGFSTRSSMATMPTTIKNMEDLGIEPTLATFSATFSTCIGQNG